MNLNVLAFDFGASSGRAIVGKYDDHQLELEEVHRFENKMLEKNGTLHWNTEYLLENILVGIKKATQKYDIKSLGIDTWGVDFGLIDASGKLLDDPVHYRDERTKGSLKYLENLISKEALYQRTGNQLMEINTLFQLLTVKNKQPELFKKIDKVLLMPDLMNYLLTGEKKSEQSISSTTQLMNPYTKKWDTELMEQVGLPTHIFPELVKEGNVLGVIKEEFNLPQIEVINVCEHDTASAVLSVPSNQNFLFISCGTWSLVGTELAEPIISKKAENYNLTNESGNNETTRFLKNCTGLWIVQELKRYYEAQGENYSYEEITDMTNKKMPFKCLIDTDDPRFTSTGNMKQKIQNYARETNQVVPETPGELFRVVYESLAFKYKYTTLEIIDAVGQEFDTVNIVGGGSKSSLLCQMVADATGMRVCAGPVEATAIGNIIQQLLTHGVVENIYEAREWIKKICQVTYYYPERKVEWEDQFSRYQKLLNKQLR